MSDRRTLSISLLALMPLVWALPQSAVAQPVEPIAPSAESTIEAATSSPQTIITTQDQHTQIEGGVPVNSNLFHRFDSFSVETGNTANFVTTESIQAVISQISSSHTSYIDGTLQVSGSDADLYLINPTGILFGPNAQLNLSGDLTATTANQIGFGNTWIDVDSTQDYSQIETGPSAYKFTSQAPGSIVNHADLAVENGNTVRLIGGEITNTGDISAPAGEITLTAVSGERLVRLDSDGALLNLEIESQPGRITPLALPELLTGESSPQATTLQTHNDGTVSLGGDVVLTGALDVSDETTGHIGGDISVFGTSVDIYGADLYANGDAGGGLIRVGGDYKGQGSSPTAEQVTFTGTASADALRSGDGGEIILWSDGITEIDGALSASGAGEGKGGLVETSGQAQLVLGESARITTDAPSGELGTWLLDPTDLTIVPADGSASVIGGANTATDTLLNQATLATALNFNNVTLAATSSITIGTAIDARGNANPGNLHLQANQINLNEQIRLQESSQLTGTAASIQLGSGGLLQNAIDAVATGGSISLAEATYSNGETFINRDVVLLGKGQKNTIFDGENTSRLFNISDGTVVINGVTIRNGDATDIGGGGMLVTGSGNLSLVDSLIEDNNAQTGSTQMGGGIYLTGTGTSAIYGTTFQSNYAGNFGGGLRTEGAHQITIENSTFNDNSAGQRGGALDRSENGGKFVLRDSTLTGNIAENLNGGGIYSGSSSSDFVIERTLFDSNFASNSGGAIASNRTQFIITDTSFINNQAEDGSGGAIATTGSLTLSDSLLNNNTAYTDGGAIKLIEDKISTIHNTTLSENSIEIGNGGAIALEDQSQLTITSSTLSGNVANAGGGAIGHRSTAAQGLNIESTTISGNIATNGAGGGLLVDTRAVAEIAQSTIANNRASGAGGGIAAVAGRTLRLNNTIVADNFALANQDISGSITSGGYNLVQDRTGSSGYDLMTDLPEGLSAQLGPLANNGGPTFTHALRGQSAAIDAGTRTGSDQRGGTANGPGDIGAYERLPVSDVLLNTGDGQTATVATAYASPLEVQVVDAFGSALDGEPVDFRASTSSPDAADVVFTSQTGVLTDSEGRGTISLSANTIAGTVDVTASSQGSSTTATLINLADAASQFILIGQASTVTAGDTNSFTLSAQDPFGNLASNYTGTVEFSSSDPQAQLPSAGTLTSGLGSFSNELRTAGLQALTATDTLNSTLTTTQNNIIVNPGAASNLTILQGNNQSAVVNTLFAEDLVVQVSDRFSNNIAGVAASFKIPQPGGSILSIPDTTDASGIFSIPIIANTIAGSTTIEALAAGLSTNFALNKLADVVSRFELAAHPTAVTAGDINPFTVTAQDQFGNLTGSYSGAVAFSSSDPQADLPTNSQLSNGTGSFTSELRTAGSQSLTARDTLNTRLLGTQSNIIVSPAEAAVLSVLGGNNQQAVIDTAFASDLTVQVNDRFDNPLIGEAVRFAAPTSGPGAALESPSVILNNLGQATTTLSANAQIGSYLVNAVIAGLSEAFNLENISLNDNPSLPTPPSIVTPIVVATTEGGVAPVIETEIPDGPLTSFLEENNSEGERESRNSLFDGYAFSQLEQALSEEYAKYWQRPLKKGASVEEVQQILQQAEEEYKSRAAIVYAVFVPTRNTAEDTDTAYSSLLSRRLITNETNSAQDELLLLLIPPEGNPIQQRVRVNRKQLQRQAQLFNIELSSFFDEGYQPLAQQLYSWLLAPIEEDIQSAGISDLMYVLDEGLSTVPLAAMMTDDTYAIERYKLSVLPSVGLLQTNFGEAPADQTVLAGGSETFTILEALPAVPVELGIVESAATASQVLLNESFSIENLRQAQAQSPKSMMHVATHAAFNPGAADSSYIQFWEEQLKLENISELGLEGLELLILSACTTALGSRDAELGFAGLAAATGVEASIGSLWNVSDLGTMALMAEFYEQLQNNPMRFAALQQAQLSLINGNTHIENNQLITQNSSVPIPPALVDQDINFSHPFFWSGFTLVGNPWW